MKEIKIYLDVPEEVEKEFYTERRSISSMLKHQGFTVSTEDLALEGEPATRGLLTSIILILTAGATYLGVKVGEKALDKILDPLLDRVLEPIIKKLEKKKKDDEKITVNVFVLVNSEEEGKKNKLPLKTNDQDKTLELSDEILVEVKRELDK